jgi:hypothetical protein
VWNDVTADNAYDSKRVVHMYEDSERTSLDFPRQAEFFIRSDGGALFHPFPQPCTAVAYLIFILCCTDVAYLIYQALTWIY